MEGLAGGGVLTAQHVVGEGCGQHLAISAQDRLAAQPVTLTQRAKHARRQHAIALGDPEGVIKPTIVRAQRVEAGVHRDRRVDVARGQRVDTLA